MKRQWRRHDLSFKKVKKNIQALFETSTIIGHYIYTTYELSINIHIYPIAKYVAETVKLSSTANVDVSRCPLQGPVTLFSLSLWKRTCWKTSIKQMNRLPRRLVLRKPSVVLSALHPSDHFHSPCIAQPNASKRGFRSQIETSPGRPIHPEKYKRKGVKAFTTNCTVKKLFDAI